MTKQRAAIIEVIHAGKFHRTADEIFAEAQKICPAISRATVYNNLKALERDKLIRRITAEDSKDRYDGSFIPHGHLFCTECGEVTDFDIPDFCGLLMDYTEGRMDSYELKVRYVCKKCCDVNN